jgi:hypothetical protein
MGASGWQYVTPYHGDVAAALRELRERVFRDQQYYWWDDFEEDEPRPATIDGIWASQPMRESGTHSILDVSRVVTTTELPDYRNRGDYGTVRPLAPDRIAHHFGTTRPTRAQFEALATDVSTPGHVDFINELTMRGAGLYVLLYGGENPAEVGFWGYSGD